MFMIYINVPFIEDWDNSLRVGNGVSISDKHERTFDSNMM